MRGPLSRRTYDLAGRVLAIEPARFLVGGAIASTVNWLSRLALSVLLSFAAAVLIAQGIGMCVGFVIYRQWVFPGSRVPIGWQIAQFLAVNAVGSLIVFLVAVSLKSLLAGHGMPIFNAEALAHAIGIAAGAVANFLGHRTLTFARSC